MKVKILKHQVRDNLYVVSTDIYKMLNRKGEPQDYMKNLFDNKSEIVEDAWLQDMTMVVPDRVYFDEKIDKALADMQLFAESYLKN
ncbi:hypothetical protein VPLG_00010 [Vibrio phage eugene 12A10]|uniref:hypothetical protein n=1 Tax=Vibrio phage eugene 12A10 TaxID=573172 RepID=UPI0003518600|nr:hypothetical protein VPLG_00010 [Vibrio phage eugene 12A10]AGN51449.1 hypothetical protein VPLG_00010 [Vibrio phage eugene 12A10]